MFPSTEFVTRAHNLGQKALFLGNLISIVYRRLRLTDEPPVVAINTRLWVYF
jgi:hypothetical protein